MEYTELEKAAIKFLNETDTIQFETFELLTMFYKQQKAVDDFNQLKEK